MKEKLQSQLEEYKRDNTQSSKEALVETLNYLPLTNVIEASDSSMLSMVYQAKNVLTAKNSNKEDIVQSVDSIISNLS